MQHKQKIVLVVVLAVVLTAGATLLAVRKSTSKTAQVVSSGTASSVSEAVPLLGDDEAEDSSPTEGASAQEVGDNGTEGWKTYRNEKYKYSLEIPHDWEIYPSSELDNVIIDSPATEKLQRDTTKGSGYVPSDLKISRYKNIISLEAFIKNDFQISKYNTFNFAKSKALEFEMGGYGSNYCILSSHNDSIFLLEFSSWDKSSLTVIDKKIISSFTFE